jgi:hypothetical protein
MPREYRPGPRPGRQGHPFQRWGGPTEGGATGRAALEFAYLPDLLDQWCDPREQRFQEMIQADCQRLAAGADKIVCERPYFDPRVIQPQLA